MAKRPIQELNTRLLTVALGSGRRWKRMAVIGGVGGALLAAGVYFAARTVDARERLALEKSWGGLNACLLGEPLQPMESAGGRVLAVQLAVVATPKTRRSTGGELPWPSNCAPLAFELAKHATEVSGDGALPSAAQALGKAIHDDPSATSDFRKLAQRLWLEAALVDLKAGPPGDGPTAPKPAIPLFTNDQFRALPRFLSEKVSLTNLKPEPYPGKKPSFLIDQTEPPDGPLLCTASDADAVIHCMKVPAEVAKLSPGLSLMGTTDDEARPFYFAGDHGQLGIFAGGGEKVAAASALSASARRDGSLMVATKKDGVKLIYAPPNAPASERPGLAPTDVDSPAMSGLFWDWLVYKTPSKPGPAHLVVRKLGDAGAELGPTVDLGEIDDATPPEDAHVSGCKTPEMLAVRVAGTRGDQVAFLAGGRWTAPVKATTHGGTLSCYGLTAVATQVTHFVDREKNYLSVTQARCNTSGCTPTTVSLKDLLGGTDEIAPPDANSSVAADLGGKLLLVWNGGYLGGLRMRLAAPDQLKTTPDTVIFDGRDESTAYGLSMFVEMRLVPAAGYALLFVNTTAGVRAFRIETTGKVVPLQSAI